MVMVKPALAYRDVVKTTKRAFLFTTCGVQCQQRICDGKGSGEKGWIDEKKVVPKFNRYKKRAGMILYYISRT